MKKFLVTFYATPEVLNQFSKATPEEVMEATKPWMAWKAANEAHVVDFGSRLTNGQERSTNTTWEKQDKVVTGFSILQGENEDQIKGILATHPQLVWSPECSLSINEFFAM